MRGVGRHTRIVVVAAVFVLAIATGAWAFQELPAKAPVNDDIGAGIDRTVSVAGENPTNADVVGGSLSSAKPAVPWAIFQQEETFAADQIFVRSFAEGRWTTRGTGTEFGRSSKSPEFSGSLNFDQEENAEAPAIDFAGTGRTVPWTTWYEETEGFEFENNVFASRFDANTGKWVFAGQSRGSGEEPGPNIPSLNLHTDHSAENPSVAGGATEAGASPVPWITWQEASVSNLQDQIFVVRGIGPKSPNCNEVTPEGVKEGENIPAIGGFCWQQVGIPRFGGDPSLNVDPSREGVEPDIAFTGKEDSVPWVVWYEKSKSTLEEPLKENEMVFAAKAKPNGVKADGNFEWVTVGPLRSGALNTEGKNKNKFGECAESVENEAGCSLNKDANKDAENPRVAAGTMTPGNPTVPWVVWDEKLGETNQIFVARLVEGTHFELANNGAPLSEGSNDSTRPDITFSGNTPYVSWREEISVGVTKGFYGHFASPTKFVLDESNVPLTPTGFGTGKADVREPISSGCIATPANEDGSKCQGSAVGTPFFLFTNGSPLRSLFADAYQPEIPPTTGGASEVTTSSGVASGAVNPLGASANVFFEYGTSTAYGQATGAAKTAPNNSGTPFAATLSGLPAGTTIHYRAVARSDFGTFVGSDQTFATKAAPAPPLPLVLNGTAKIGRAKIKGTTAFVPVSCSGPKGATCKLRLRLTVTEILRGHKLVALTAKKKKLKRKVVVVGSASVTLSAGHSRTVKISLNGTGRKLLAKRHKLKVRLRVTQTFASAPGAAAIRPRTISTQILTFKARKRHKHHH